MCQLTAEERPSRADPVSGQFSAAAGSWRARNVNILDKVATFLLPRVARTRGKNENEAR